MTIWVAAQSPPALAGWLTEQFGVEAANLDSVGLGKAQDIEVFQHARRPGNARARIPSRTQTHGNGFQQEWVRERILAPATKDDDFVDSVTRLDPPPQILWGTCGNVTNRALRELLARAFPAARAHLAAGEPVVELTNQQ